MMKTNYRPCFPQRLFLLLKLVEEKGLDHIVSWVNDGAAFKVHDLKKFQNELLPKYFSTNRYASFTRQLCAYGFSCLRTGRQTGIYSHPSFHRNDPASSFQIKRESAKKSAAKAAIAHRASKPVVKAPMPDAVVPPPIPQATPVSFEFPAVFGSGRFTSADHTDQLGQLHQILCTTSPVQEHSTQPAMMAQPRPTPSHRRSVSYVSLPSEDEINAPNTLDLEPIPILSKQDPLLGQSDYGLNGSSTVKTEPVSNFVPMSPVIYGQPKQVDLVPEELLAPIMEPNQSMMVTPI